MAGRTRAGAVAAFVSAVSAVSAVAVVSAVAGLVAVAPLPVGGGTQVAAAAGEIATLPSANPANFTPNVLDGEVDAIVQIGGRIVIGGRFTQVANAAQHGGAVYARSGIAAFDATTGRVDEGFAPVLSSYVNVLVPSGDGTSVYAAGDFNTVNGVTRRKVARIDLSTGALVTSFNAGGMNGQVRDMKLHGGTLYIAGNFTTVAGQARQRIASLHPVTGALTTKVTVPVSGTHNGGTSAVYKFDITPAGDRLLVVGNFTAVDGQSRRQVAMLDTSGPTATVAAWQTAWYTATCASAFDSYLRDVDISPDGSFAVISTTGAYRAGTSCDTISRFEVQGATTMSPTWVNSTGGDTTYAVEVAGGVVFVGGHMRWVNNPSAADAAGPGATPREGILALDPVNGMPFSWNPGRERGVGVFDFLVTDAGLWAGSDTDRWADEMRQRLAFFPFAGGTLVPANDPGALPADVFLLGRSAGTTGTDPSVLHRVNAGGPALASADDGPAWAADTSSGSTVRNSGSAAASYAHVGILDATVPAADFDRAPVALFATERYDPAGGQELQWSFPVTAGTPIQVRLYMSSRCTCTNDPGERVFDVDLDGVTVLDDLDLSASVGFNVATVRSFDVTSDGSVTILLRHGVENPTINAIEIVRRDVSGVGSLGTQDEVQRRFYNGGSRAAANTVMAGALPWRNVRGAFMVNGTLYTGNVDGTMVRRAFDGVTFGAAQPVAMYGSTMIGEMPNVTGMFYDPVQGRLYYTLSGDANLYYRSFTPEASSVGASRSTATGAVAALDPTRVRGMFLSGGAIHFADATTGALMRIGFAGGAVSGIATVVESSADWRGRGMFVSTAAPVPGPNTAPTAAAFTSSCTFTTCTFTDGGSTDLDGTVTAHRWSFGDGAGGNGSPVTHSFPATGEYVVTLTVVDDDGAVDDVLATVHVQEAPNVAPVPVITATCSAMRCELDASGSSDGDGSVVDWAWDLGDGTTAAGSSLAHAYGTDGTYTVTLTVTDDDGATASTATDVAVRARTVEFRASSGASSTGAAAPVTVPAAVQPGDQLLLFVTTNANTTATTPTGWTLLGTQVDGTPDMRSWVFTTVAGPSSAGSAVATTLGSSTAKSTRLLLAYAGAGAPSVLASAVTGPTTSAHSAPPVSSALDGSVVVAHWADKSAGHAGWTLPAELTGRQAAAGTGAGQIVAAAGDTGPLVAGTWPGATATSATTSSKAIMWSVVVPSGRPLAAVSASCAGLVCRFDGSGSTDADGSIVAYAWDLGDGATASGATTEHEYAAAGTYQVALTVTDDDGATGSAIAEVTVAPTPNRPPGATFTAQCLALQCTLDGTGSGDADGSVVAYAWDLGVGTASGPTTSITFPAAGTYPVALTVTDDDGATSTTRQDVVVADVVVGFRAAASANSGGASAAITVPPAVQPGDQLVLFVTVNADTAISTPAGWTLLGTQVDGTPDMRSAVFTTTAAAGVAGSTVAVTLGSTTAKSSRVLLAYGGAGVPTLAVSAVAGASTTVHRTPAVPVDRAGSVVVGYWSDKTGGNAGWTAGEGVSARQQSLGSGSGQITALAGDTGPLLSGTHPGASATSSAPSAKAIHWSVVVPTA